MNTKNREKIFTPLILFNNIRPNLEDQKYLINDHRLKVEKFLEHNTQIWENEGSYHDSSLETTSEENSIHESISGQFNYNLTNSFSNQNETSIIGVLEPTRINAPPPLHSIGILPIDKKTRISDVHLNIKASKEQGSTTAIEPLNHRAESSSSTATFISEPQFHHIYKPHVNRKRRGNLPKEVTEFLKQWLLLHKRHPYPTEREKQQLADETGLMVSQISNWFINARRRILQPLLESENRQQMIQTSRANLETFSGTQTYYIDTPNGNIESNSSDVLLTKQDQQSVYYTENVHNLNNRFNNNNHYL